MEHHNEYIAVVLVLLVGLGVFYFSNSEITGMVVRDYCPSGVKSYCAGDNYYLCSEEGVLGPFSCGEKRCEETEFKKNKMALCL